MYFIYTLIFGSCLLLVSPYYLLRFRRYLPTLPDRMGFLRVQLDRSIWIHAVSVGEVKAIEKLLEGLGKRVSGRPIVVSTATPTGQQLAKQRADIIHSTFYFPLDLPGCVRRALDRVRPEMVIIAETEIWPNFLRECRRRKIPVLMINGRISDRSFGKYRLVRHWLERVLADYTLLGMQSQTDRQRMEALGGDPGKVTVLGNLKFDFTTSDRAIETGLASVLKGWDEIWIAASTMPEEEEMVLDAYAEVRRSHPELKLVIAPRHPERCDAVAAMVRARGLRFIRRTALSSPGAPSPAASGHAFPEGPEGEGLLLDTIGELAGVFEYATVVFMGGTLVPRGGHNILEPARHRKPVIFGPHMENFRDIARLFLEAGAAIQIGNPEDLARAVTKILSNPELAEKLGNAAQRVVDENTGATDRVLKILTPVEAGH
jgi:3-deoxy-D-manno-octulosonic-acid transferase